ncbi:MAG: methyltransferase [Caulobacteraceae bacterium]|nr:methyltransferase [Caulobacteraceae bacterium]
MPGPIKSALLAASAALLMAGSAMATTAAATAAVPPAVAAALADPARSPAEKARDAARKAAEVAAFTQVKPGDMVADVFPGGGYFTRIFAKIVGPAGRVYGVVRQPSKDSNALGSDPAFPNIRIAAQPWEQFNPPEKLDVVFNSQFFHDLYNPEYGAAGGGPQGAAKVHKAIFEALKPGGVYIVIDHAGRPGTGATEFSTLHRIDEPVVMKALTDAGFVLEAHSDILRNPADPRTAGVFDPSIRGNTDQFMLRFRKPKR